MESWDIPTETLGHGSEASTKESGSACGLVGWLGGK